MNFGLECKKVKRTGFFTVFVCGGVLAAMIPVLNMAARTENYLGLEISPVQILLDANWQMMAMLNVLLVVSGACLLYHIEYTDNAIQKMYTLPGNLSVTEGGNIGFKITANESRLFFGKVALLIGMCVVTLTIEAAGIAFCSGYWFVLSGDVWLEIIKNGGYALLLMFPAVLSSLLIAAVCKNMWISLGIGVVCVFTATMLPAKNFVLSLFPFALPFQIFAGAAENTTLHYMLAAVTETFIIEIAAVLLLKVRRSFV